MVEGLVNMAGHGKRMTIWLVKVGLVNVAGHFRRTGQYSWSWKKDRSIWLILVGGLVNMAGHGKRTGRDGWSW